MSDEEVLEERDQVEEAFGELLASLIQQHPCLYDKSCKAYKDKAVVAATWASIADTCNIQVDALQKQWKILRGQFTREHRAQKTYEPSGTGNDTSKRPRKTWYLYESLLFLAPHVAHRKTCSNFVRKKTVTITEQSTQSTLQCLPESPSQLPLQSASVIECYNDDDVTISAAFPSERLASSSSSISSVDQVGPVTIAKRNWITPPPDKFAIQKTKDARKEQENLSQLIGETTEAIKLTMSSLSKKYSQSIDNNNEEEEGMARALICGLRRVNMTYKLQCYMECLSVLDKYQKLTAQEIAKTMII